MCPLTRQHICFFNHLCWAAWLILVLPSTSTSSERSISAMQRLKSYLPRTMGQLGCFEIMILKFLILKNKEDWNCFRPRVWPSTSFARPKSKKGFHSTLYHWQIGRIHIAFPRRLFPLLSRVRKIIRSLTNGTYIPHTGMREVFHLPPHWGFSSLANNSTFPCN